MRQCATFYLVAPTKPHERGAMTTKQFAIAYASKLVSDYPEEKTVQSLMNRAQEAGRFKNNTEMLAVWGRVCRLLPQEEIN